jgi:uncharacterized protein YdhG (YjbR/CyaY superfamily)
MIEKNFIDAYISTAPIDFQEKLTQLRTLAQTHLPNVIETNAYKMPTFKRKKNIIHFAYYKNHIGIYPGPIGISYLATIENGLNLSKGAWKIDIKKPLPVKLISILLVYLNALYL